MGDENAEQERLRALGERAKKLANNPEIHDPEALRFLLDGFAAKTLDLVRELATRDALIETCKALANSHQGACGITDAIAIVLNQRLSSEVVKVTQIPITEKGFNLPNGEGVVIEGRTDVRGHWARALSIKDGREVARVGPFPDAEQATEAIQRASLEVLLGSVVGGSKSDAPGVGDLIRMAMGRRSDGQVH
jgi:hypothetical protein